MAESVGIATSADAPVPPELGAEDEVLIPKPEQELPAQPVAAKPESKVYTDYTEIQKDHFPQKFDSQPKKWVSQKKDLLVLIQKSYLDIPSAIPFKDRMGNVAQLNQIFFGGYKIKFDGFNYISKNKLEELSLEKQPKVICLGPA